MKAKLHEFLRDAYLTIGVGVMIPLLAAWQVYVYFYHRHHARKAERDIIQRQKQSIRTFATARKG